MAFPSAFLDEIRARVSLAAVIGRRVKLIRKGREFHGLCPFHNEKTPSFTVNEDKGFFHCFGCGAHGDVIGYEMRAGHLSFPEAIERLAAEAGLEVPQQRPEEREQAKRAASLLDATEIAAAFFEAQLRAPAGREALNYLHDRGLDDQTIAQFRLGFSPDQRTALKAALKAAEIPEALAIEAGLLIAPEGGGESYDRFRGRVMFPISDRRARVIAFGGRILGEGQPKYLNSPETPLFHKGSVLYGLAQAREPAAKARSIIVCEGYMDVIAMAKAGFDNSVAPLGTALTEEQIELLWRLAPEPIICLDGDSAGQRAALRAAMRALPLLKPGFSLKFAMLPAPEDPDSLIKKKGKDAIRQLIKEARPLSQLLWNDAYQTHPVDTPEQRAALATALTTLSNTIKDKFVSKEYGAYFKSRYWEYFGFQRKRQEENEKRRHLVRRGPDGRLPGLSLPELPSVDITEQAENLILLFTIKYPHILEKFHEHLGGLNFKNHDSNILRQDILIWHSKSSEHNSTELANYLAASDSRFIIDYVLTTPIREDYSKLAATEVGAEKAWMHLYDIWTVLELRADRTMNLQMLGLGISDESLARFNLITEAGIERANLLGIADVLLPRN